jgi:hypothetical protein
VADLVNEAKQLRKRAWELAPLGKIPQAVNMLKRATETRKRPDAAHEAHRFDILQGNAKLLGNMVAMSYFAEEFRAQ